MINKKPSKITLLFAIFFAIFGISSFSNGSISDSELIKLKSSFENFIANKSYNDGDSFLKITISSIESRTLTDGMKLDIVREVFGNKIIFPEISVESRIKKNVGMIPLEKSYWNKNRKLPGVPGPIWFLLFDVNKNNEIHRLSLRYMTVKDLYMDWHEK